MTLGSSDVVLKKCAGKTAILWGSGSGKSWGNDTNATLLNQKVNKVFEKKDLKVFMRSVSEKVFNDLRINDICNVLIESGKMSINFGVVTKLRQKIVCLVS